jgi:PadR family transcriptional regulator PadR
VPDRRTRDAVRDAAPLDAAHEAAGSPVSRRSGPADPLVNELRRAGLLPLLVLHLLGSDRSYGNQLMERIGTLTGGLLVVNPNTMYPLLRDLEARGLIAGEWEHPERRTRRFYTRTPAGAAEAARLLEDVGPRLDDVARTVDLLRAELDPAGRPDDRG